MPRKSAIKERQWSKIHCRGPYPLERGLYERVRAEALALHSVGLFFECFPDEADQDRQPELLQQNADRLRFYENYGARPIVNTAYQTPVSPHDEALLPYLVFDNLGQEAPLRRDTARIVVCTILERKYGHLYPPEYIDMMVASFCDDPIQLRQPRYIRRRARAQQLPPRVHENTSPW